MCFGVGRDLKPNRETGLYDTSQNEQKRSIRVYPQVIV